MPGLARFRTQIAVLYMIVLVLSVVRIAYEFHTAQHSIAPLADRGDNTAPSFPHHLSRHPAAPSLPHLSHHPAPSLPHLSHHPPPSLPHHLSHHPPPSLPHHLSHHPAPSPPLPDLRTTLFSPFHRERSGMASADVKIHSDNMDVKIYSHDNIRIDSHKNTDLNGHAAQNGGGSTSLARAAPAGVSGPFPGDSAPGGWGRLVGKATHPVLVIVVCSRPENTELRLAMRRSWGMELEVISKVLLRFFVGHSDDWNTIITREQDLHGDVVRTEYVDTYENLSYKVLAALSWVLHNVGSVQYVMKIDDDTYVNLSFLLNELQWDNSHVILKDPARAYVMGAVCVNASVVRDEGDKWFASRLDYPSDVYPTYVFGGGYVMTKSAAVDIMAASLRVDYLHLEDVFVTGILARAAGVDHVAHPGFVFWTSPRPSPCDLVTGRRLTAVSLTSKQFYVMYSGVHAILRAGNWTSC